MAERPKPLLVALAEDLKVWFPEMEGRVLPVSEIDPFTEQTKPTMPLVTVGLVRENAAQGTSNSRITIADDIAVVFMLKPERYLRKDQAESPFWSFYDYEAIRDVLLSNMQGWRTPNNGGVVYRQMDIEADEFAVYIAFTFRTEEQWCAMPFESDACTMSEVDGRPIRISANICAPKSENCGPIDEAEPKDPCPGTEPEAED